MNADLYPTMRQNSGCHILTTWSLLQLVRLLNSLIHAFWTCELINTSVILNTEATVRYCLYHWRNFKAYVKVFQVEIRLSITELD